jgi:hypothetical protein
MTYAYMIVLEYILALEWTRTPEKSESRRVETLDRSFLFSHDLMLTLDDVVSYYAE